MTTNRAKVFIYGNEHKRGLVAGKEKNAYISDCVIANRAIAYIYGIKEHRRLVAVIKTNVCIAECMRYIPPEPEPETVTESRTITACSIFVLYFIRYDHLLSLNIAKI
jgi:hypothetical protein